MAMFMDDVKVVEHIVEYGVRYESGNVHMQAATSDDSARENAQKLNGEPMKREVFIGEWEDVTK